MDNGKPNHHELFLVDDTDALQLDGIQDITIDDSVNAFDTVEPPQVSGYVSEPLPPKTPLPTSLAEKWRQQMNEEVKVGPKRISKRRLFLLLLLLIAIIIIILLLTIILSSSSGKQFLEMTTTTPATTSIITKLVTPTTTTTTTAAAGTTTSSNTVTPTTTATTTTATTATTTTTTTDAIITTSITMSPSTTESSTVTTSTTTTPPSTAVPTTTTITIQPTTTSTTQPTTTSPSTQPITIFETTTSVQHTTAAATTAATTTLTTTTPTTTTTTSRTSTTPTTTTTLATTTTVDSTDVCAYNNVDFDYTSFSRPSASVPNLRATFPRANPDDDPVPDYYDLCAARISVLGNRPNSTLMRLVGVSRLGNITVEIAGETARPGDTICRSFFHSNVSNGEEEIQCPYVKYPGLASTGGPTPALHNDDPFFDINICTGNCHITRINKAFRDDFPNAITYEGSGSWQIRIQFTTAMTFQKYGFYCVASAAYRTVAANSASAMCMTGQIGSTTDSVSQTTSTTVPASSSPTAIPTNTDTTVDITGTATVTGEDMFVTTEAPYTDGLLELTCT